MVFIYRCNAILFHIMRTGLILFLLPAVLFCSGHSVCLTGRSRGNRIYFYEPDGLNIYLKNLSYLLLPIVWLYIPLDYLCGVNDRIAEL